MLATTLTFTGANYSVSQATLRMKKNVRLAKMDDMLVKMPAGKGNNKCLRLVLSDREDAKRHCKEVADKLSALMSFIAEEKNKYPKLSVYISTGIGAGSKKHFTKSFVLPASMMAQLAALGIEYEFTAYPCND